MGDAVKTRCYLPPTRRTIQAPLRCDAITLLMLSAKQVQKPHDKVVLSSSYWRAYGYKIAIPHYTKRLAMDVVRPITDCYEAVFR